MPHVRALFVEDERIMNLLREKKLAIREAVGRQTGYSLGEIALIPEMVPAGLQDMADNLLPLEFIIDVGTKCAGQTKSINPKIKRRLLQIEGLSEINFGVWLRTMSDNDFIEHVPA